MRIFNERYIVAAFERWRYGKASNRVPMKEIFEAGFHEGVEAERESQPTQTNLTFDLWLHSICSDLNSQGRSTLSEGIKYKHLKAAFEAGRK